MKTKIWLSLEPDRRQNPLNCQIICELWSKTENKYTGTTFSQSEGGEEVKVTLLW